MYAASIKKALSARLRAASPIQTRHIHSVGVNITPDAPQTAWITIIDRTDIGELTDHLFNFSWTDVLIMDSLIDSVIKAYLYSITDDEHVARELSPHLGMNNTTVAEVGGQQ